MNLRNNKWIVFALIYTSGIAVILYLAYTKGIPNWIAFIPHYDLLGHFFLYGIWGYLVHRAFNRNKAYGLPVGPAILTVLTIVEELMQNFSMNRTFSLLDLFASLMGIWLVIFVYEWWKKR